MEISRTDQLIRTFFADNAEAFRLFTVVRDFIETHGAVEVVPRKTQIGFKRSRAFAWVWLPQMWIRKQPQGSITLTLSLDRRVGDRRIKQSVEAYRGRFTHHIVITRASDFDTRVKGWLREAYELAGRSRWRA